MKRGLFVILLSFMVFSCSTEKVELYNTVRAYNRLLKEAYLKKEPGIERFFATRAELKRISAFILLHKVKGRVLEINLLSQRFVDWKLYRGGRDALVVAKERWKNRYLNIETLYPLTNYWTEEVTKRYHLKYEDNRWKVDWIETQPY